MIISGHQPVYLPWLGLFHKLALCDVFVYMDTVQYLENDWNNRNKIRIPNGTTWLTVPIDKKLSKSHQLNDIFVYGFNNPKQADFWQTQHWKSIEYNYKKCKYFDLYADELREFYLNNVWEKLIDICWVQFNLFRKWLQLDSIKIVRMSEFQFEGKKDLLVLDHCLKLGGDKVVFGKHGRDYVDLSNFTKNNIKVHFQDYNHPVYTQRFKGFESHLSVLDLILNHGPDSRELLLSNNLTKENLNSELLWEK